MLYYNQCREQAHREVEEIFRTLLPERGLAVREEQIRLCHEMLSTLLEGKIALCDAGVGIGKTYAYLVAGILVKKHASGRLSRSSGSVTVSTSGIALQRAVMEEYLPFLSGILLEKGIIQSPLKGIVRKGKEHFVCDRRLALRLEAVKDKKKNEKQREALASLRLHYDMDKVQNLSGFDRRLVSVPGFCPNNCPAGHFCRYRKYLKRALDGDITFQICNHNYLLADALHRERGCRPLLVDYGALIVDEAHQLPEAARQMYGMSLCRDEVLEISHYLEREHCKKEARGIRETYARLLDSMKAAKDGEKGRADREIFTCPEECMPALKETASVFEKTAEKLKGGIPAWILNRLEEAAGVLEVFSSQEKSCVLYMQEDQDGNTVFCATSREIPERLYKTLWGKNFPAILTSGTLKAGNGFERTRQSAGLCGPRPVKECVAESPFAYDENCLLYLPDTVKECRKGSQRESEMIARHIRSLVCSTCGHTLVLFTSYSLMGSVCRILRKDMPFPMVEVWRHAQEEIAAFKTMENAVLLAAGSCWEGVDFPGDMVSSLIIVRLPFSVPDPISEAERENYGTLREYIQAIALPDMQKKLRQGFGRAIRTEQDTCVVSILDHRAVPGGRYHEDVLCVLPKCRRTGSLKEVEAFIRERKREGYYL